MKNFMRVCACMLMTVCAGNTHALTAQEIVHNAFATYRLSAGSVEKSTWIMVGEKQGRFFQIIKFDSAEDVIMTSFYAGSHALKRKGFAANVTPNVADNVMRMFCPGGFTQSDKRSVFTPLSNPVKLDPDVGMPWAAAILATGIGDVSGTAYTYRQKAEDIDGNFVIETAPVASALPTRIFTITKDFTIEKIEYIYNDAQRWSVIYATIGRDGARWYPTSIATLSPDDESVTFTRDEQLDKEAPFPKTVNVQSLPCKR